jgi:hypothetical protein
VKRGKGGEGEGEYVREIKIEGRKEKGRERECGTGGSSREGEREM